MFILMLPITPHAVRNTVVADLSNGKKWAIADAAPPLFAHQGFHGTPATRIAPAAYVIDAAILKDYFRRLKFLNSGADILVERTVYPIINYLSGIRRQRVLIPFQSMALHPCTLRSYTMPPLYFCSAAWWGRAA